MIVGWRVASHMRTTIVLDPIEMARWSRGKTLAGLRCHSDAGSQFTSIRYGERLAEIGAVPSIGTIGDSYDKGLASRCTSCCGLGGNSFSQRAALSGGEAGVVGGRRFGEAVVFVVCLVGVGDSGLCSALDGGAVHFEALGGVGSG